MNSREKILQRVKENQPPALPRTVIFSRQSEDGALTEKFKSVLLGIGGAMIVINDMNEFDHALSKVFPALKSLRVAHGDVPFPASHHHEMDRIDVVIISAEFGVSENAAIWVTSDALANRALPFICEHLVITLKKSSLVPTLHEAYHLLENKNYHFGTFLAGPSKTADIEQSLVIGAHGAKSLTVFLFDDC